MNNIKLPLALDSNTNKLIHISEVKKEDVKNYNFVCPACKAELITRMGEENVHHFAHKADCGINGESIVHLLAKKIISENNKIVLPIFNPITLRWQNIEHSYTFIESEKKYGDIIPDAVVEIGGRTIFIEIANTHFIDDEKLQKLKKIGIETWEIEVDDKYFFDYEDIKGDVLRAVDNKKSIVLDISNYKDYLNKDYIQLAKKNLLHKTLRKQYLHYKKNNIKIKKNEKFPLDDEYNYFRVANCNQINPEEYWIKIEKGNRNIYGSIDINVYIYDDIKNNLDEYWVGHFTMGKSKYYNQHYSYCYVKGKDWASNIGCTEMSANSLFFVIESLLNRKSNNLRSNYDWHYQRECSLFTPIK